MNHDSRRLGIPSRFRLFGTRSRSGTASSANIHRRCESIHSSSGGDAPSSATQQGDNAMSLGTIVLIILVIALLGGFSGLGGGPFYGTGYYGGGGLGLILVIVLVLVLLGKL